MAGKKFYITTTLPYVNADPHIGFALEIIQADVIARYHKILGEDVFFNFGTDEHGQKVYQKAKEEGKDPKAYCDEYAKKFNALKVALNLSYTNFIRTTDEHHIQAAQELWRRCVKNGFIEKGIYKSKYCVGCELEKQDSELVDGKCPLHPNLNIELIEEENYFFKFSLFQEKLLNFYQKNPAFVVPENRLSEIKNFVGSGLQDFSVSRLKEKMPWGISVPDDDKHIMYVWFDALTNYISTLGWPEDEKNFEEYWGTDKNPNAIQVAGKDNLRQQTAMWQAMLMAANLPPTKQVYIHGFITSGGQKMSKSLGNVINPFHYVENYGTDALRYYLLAKISPFEDGDFTENKFIETYNADLANGLGNLIARVATMTEKSGISFDKKEESSVVTISDKLEEYRFDLTLEEIWKKIRSADIFINENKVWELKEKDLEKALTFLVNQIRQISYDLKPFLPETAEKIEKQFAGSSIKSEKSLFPRIK